MTDAHSERPTRALPLSQLVTLSIYWFGIVIIWGGLNKIILPAMIGRQPGGTENLGVLLAIVVTVGVIAPILIQPTIGMISDYTVTRWGRRKPYIVVGTLLDIVFLFGLATSQTYIALVAFYFLLQLSSNAAQGPFQGYVPDLVPARQVGLASGLMGTMIVLGTIAGVGIATLGITTASLFAATMALGVVEVLTMVILAATVHEGTAAPMRTRSWLGVARSAWGTDILRQSSVLWLLVVRLLFLGAYAATSLALPYFQRAHGMTEGDASTTVFLGTAIVGVMTALSAIPGARLSDRFGRKPVIWVAALIAGIGLAGVAFAPTTTFAIVAFVPFGIGMGAFLSVDWALMTDVIPKHTSGRYMGILNAGTAMAEPVYLIVAGPLALDLLGRLIGEASGARSAMLVGVVFLVGAARDQTRRIGPRELSVEVTPRYRLMWGMVRAVMRTLFAMRVSGLEHWPKPPFQIVANHHNGFDPMLVISVAPLEPRITWFGPKEADFSRGFKNRIMAFFGGMIPYNPDGTTLTSAVRSVRRVFGADGVLGIFAEGRIGFRESDLLSFEEGAVAFAVASRVPVVPCAIVGSTDLWFRRRIEIRFGPPIATEDVRGREARAELDAEIRAAVAALLPHEEPRLPRHRPLSVLTDMLNGDDDIARRREER